MPRIANIFDGTRAERAAAARSFTVGILHDSDRILQVMRIIFREISSFRVPLSRSKISGWRAFPDRQRVAGSVDDIGHPPTRFFFPSSEQAVESQGRSFSRRRDAEVRTERHRVPFRIRMHTGNSTAIGRTLQERGVITTTLAVHLPKAMDVGAASDDNWRIPPPSR